MEIVRNNNNGLVKLYVVKVGPVGFGGIAVTRGQVVEMTVSQYEANYINEMIALDDADTLKAEFSPEELKKLKVKEETEEGEEKGNKEPEEGEEKGNKEPEKEETNIKRPARK